MHEYMPLFHILLFYHFSDDRVFIATHGQGYYEWRYYVQTCFKNSCSPISYDDIMSSPIVNATGPSWSNVIRSDVIFKYNG